MTTEAHMAGELLELADFWPDTRFEAEADLDHAEQWYAESDDETDRWTAAGVADDATRRLIGHALGGC